MIQSLAETKLDPAVVAVLPNGCQVKSVEVHGKTNWSKGYKVTVLLLNGDIKAYFMKVVDRKFGYQMVLGEYVGQGALRQAIPNNIPLPVAYGVYDLDRSKHFYLAEFHNMLQSVPEPQPLISILKQLYQDAVSPTGKFGFSVTTYKGYLPLQVTCLRGQNEELQQLAEQLFEKVIPRLLRPLQTGGRSIKPTLCHGDLWHGNIGVDVDTQQWILFDSCAVYAHNEFELSLFRASRYFLNKSHVDEYKKEIPISEPAEDFDDRNALYSLRNDIVVSALWDHLAVELRRTSIAEMRRLIAKYPHGIDDFKE